MVEKMWDYHENSDNISTSQEAKNWNERSKNSKLNEILQKLDKEIRWQTKINKSKKAQKLHTMLVLWKYKDFQKEIWMTNCDWKLWGETFDNLKNYLENLNQTENTQKNIQQELSNLWLSIKKTEQTTNGNNTVTHLEVINNQVNSSKINRPSKKILSEYKKLPEEDFNKIFSQKEKIQQWGIWDCFLVNAITALSNAQYFKTLIMNSVSRVRFKDDNSLWYNIKIPLWQSNGRDILIKDSELNIAEIKWNDGYKLLETAYVKSIRKNDSEWNKYSPVTKTEFGKFWEKWWSVTVTLRAFLGKHNVWFNDFWTLDLYKENKTLSELSINKKLEIVNFLKKYNWNIWDKYLFVWTPKSSEELISVWEIGIPSSHSLAISGCDFNDDWSIAHIHLKNPINEPSVKWWGDFSLNLYQFFKATACIEQCNINSNNLLKG